MIYKDGIEDKQEQTSTSATKYHVSLIVQRELEIIQSADHQKQSMIHKWWLPSWIVQGTHDVPVSACQIQIKQSDFTCTTFMWAVAKRVISWIVKSEFRRFYKDLLWVYKTSPVRCSKSLPHPERGGLKIQEWSLPGLSQIPFCVDTCLLTYSLTHSLPLTYLLTYLLAYFFTYLLTCLLAYLFTYLLIYLLTCLLTYLRIYLLTYLLTYLLACLLIYVFTYLLIYLLTYLLAYLFTYLLTSLLPCFLACLLACLLAYSLTHSLTYLLTSFCINKRSRKKTDTFRSKERLGTLARGKHLASKGIRVLKHGGVYLFFKQFVEDLGVSFSFWENYPQLCHGWVSLKSNSSEMQTL